MLTLVCASAWSVELATARTNRADAAAQGTEIAAAITRQAAANSAYFEATSALFVSAQTVSPEFFHQFVDRLRLDYDLSGVAALGWSEAVSRRDLPALTARMASEGHPDFHISPEPTSRDQTVHVITMLEPRTPSNLTLLGFNMYSEARRRDAMDRARRTGAMAATDPIQLVVDRNRKTTPGLIVYLPVNAINGDHRFKGFVYGAIRTQDFIRAAVKSDLLSSGRVEIFDATNGGRELIFSSGQGDEETSRPIEQNLSVFGQHWILRFSQRSMHGLSPLTLVVLVGGVSFSLLLLAYILLVQRRNEDLQSLLSAQADRETERAAFVRELNHRVKNSLSNVTSIIALTRRNATDLNSFTNNLLERVRALAASHSLLDGAQWGPTDLKALVEAQLSSHDHAEDRIRIDGPNVLISPNDALSLGLALHELLTNAIRYGALSTNEGHVSIHWHIVGEAVSVQWEERGGPAASEPAKRGFGLNLIERALAQELGTPITIEFPSTGLRCQFSIPLRAPKSFRLRADRTGVVSPLT
ncbi:CHASE domain-containing protein [Sphingobium nicotianae]|uniref:histidine kinase n=1 Tax=Sphingobium nicotianae TaxID=2782607 RepID=A0A9X1DGI8_9SPHN|nr:CHASE domain-containing protein [Sphingobium nicotianae]MBT2189003.1 CHASE domain-containing protein [Sphingobium nicotianae]